MDGIECTRRFREYERSHARRASTATKSGVSQLQQVPENEAVAAAVAGDKSKGSSAHGSPRDSSKERNRAALADKLAEKRGIDRLVTPRKLSVGSNAAAAAAAVAAHVARLPIIGMSANNDTLSKESAIEVRLGLSEPFRTPTRDTN
jgi:hypothetical protein